MNDKDFDAAKVNIDSYCAIHDIDEYDLHGEIMAEDGDGSGFGDNIIFDY